MQDLRIFPFTSALRAERITFAGWGRRFVRPQPMKFLLQY